MQQIANADAFPVYFQTAGRLVNSQPETETRETWCNQNQGGTLFVIAAIDGSRWAQTQSEEAARHWRAVAVAVGGQHININTRCSHDADAGADTVVIPIVIPYYSK